MADDENGPKTRQHELGSEDGEMADILELRFEHEVIYNHGKGQWHMFNPGTGLWLPDKIRDVPDRVDQIALEMVTAAAVDRSKEGEKRVKVFRRLREVGRTESALKSLSAREKYKTDGSIFDTNPNLLGVRNGVLDLETMKLCEGDVRKQYVSKSCAVAWPTGGRAAEGRAAAQAKPFFDFLLDILGGNKDLMHYVLRLLGYSLLGTTQEEKFWLLVGGGRNGKGTLTKLMYWLTGDYGGFLDQALYMRNHWGDVGSDRARPELGNLWGKRFTVTSEPVQGAFNEQMLKAHTGRDPITFRRMRSDILWTFNPTHKLFFLTQDAPSVEDVGPSMRARARVIQFEQSYVGREDQQLQEKLQAVGQGILVVLAEQARDYLREGLAENAKVLAWSNAYMDDNDPMTEFLGERCNTGRELSVAAKLVYAAWQDWATINDREPWTARKFGGMFGKVFKRVHTETGEKYLGVALKGAMEVAHASQDDD